MATDKGIKIQHILLVYVNMYNSCYLNNHAIIKT